MRVRVVLCIAMLGGAVRPGAQVPTFDAVAISVNASGTLSGGIGPRGSGIAATNATLRSLIQWAWERSGQRLVGGDAWIDRTRYDVVATAAGNPPLDRLRLMARAMLADRFKVTTHTETRQLPIYALVVAREGRLGPQLRRSTTPCETQFCGSRISGGNIESKGIALADLADILAGPAGRVVVDRTGLTGPFDLDLRYARDPGGTAAAADLPSVFTAVEEQLGLRLEAATGPVEVLVIDGAEPPAAN